VEIELRNFTRKYARVVELRESHRAKLIIFLPDPPNKAAEREKHERGVLVDTIGDSFPNTVKEIIASVQFIAWFA
jgi:hypothetical protein